MATHDKEYRLYRISPEKSLTKQRAIATTIITTTEVITNGKPWGGSDFQSGLILILQGKRIILQQ